MRPTAKSGSIGVEKDRLVAPAPAGDYKRRFGQAVHRIKGLPAEAAIAEGLIERSQCFAANRLGAVVRDAPTRKVESVTLFGVDLSSTEVIREVGTTAVRGTILSDRAQPADGTLEESGRRHQIGRVTRVGRLENSFDQPHIVDDRKPGNGNTVGVILLHVIGDGEVVEEVTVRDHHPTRCGSGTRSVLKEGQS